MTAKKIPQRMCIGCSEMKPKKELIRIVKNKNGDIFLDTTGKAQGRGAYICKSEVCLQKAAKAKRLERAFRAQIDASIYDNLKGQLSSDE